MVKFVKKIVRLAQHYIYCRATYILLEVACNYLSQPSLVDIHLIGLFFLVCSVLSQVCSTELCITCLMGWCGLRIPLLPVKRSIPNGETLAVSHYPSLDADIYLHLFYVP